MKEHYLLNANRKLLTYRKTKPGLLTFELDLPQLYDSKEHLAAFMSRFKEFLKSDSYNRHIYRLRDNILVFNSEQLIPSKIDSRPPLLLVFGNPASHSVKEGMFFSFEGDGKEHRFWKDIMRPIKLLEMSVERDIPFEEKNRIRKKKILDLKYRSPYCIGFSVFVSLPSGPSGPWSGIGGIHKLLGARAMKMLEPFERKRIVKIVSTQLGIPIIFSDAVKPVSVQYIGGSIGCVSYPSPSYRLFCLPFKDRGCKEHRSCV